MVKPYEHGDQCLERRANDFSHLSRSWLSLTHSGVCSRVAIAGLEPTFARFACSVIPAAQGADMGRWPDQGQLKAAWLTLTVPCLASESLLFGRAPTTLTEKSDSLCLSHSGKLYGLYPAPASLWEPGILVLAKQMCLCG